MQKADNKIYLFEQSNAAVTLAAPVLLAFNAINNLFGVGSSSMMSRALGRKDYETVFRSSAFGFYCSIICGIIFSLLCTVFQNPLLVLLGADETTMQATREYMFWTVNCGAVPAILNVVMAYLVRSEGSAMHASIGTMSGCLLNIVLDPVFILPWGFDMGAGGAGLAQKDIVSGVCAVGIPASIQNLLNVTGMTILNNFSSSYGASAVAAIGICQKIYMVPMYISQGISQGVMPLISYTFSSNNIPRMKHAVSFARKAALTIIISVALLFFLFPGFWVELFMKDATIVEYGSHLLRRFCMGLPFLSIDFLAVGVFQAVGMGRESLLFAILRKVVLEIPALFILNALFGLYGLASAQFCAEVILATAAILVLRKLFKRLEESVPAPQEG